MLLDFEASSLALGEFDLETCWKQGLVVEFNPKGDEPLEQSYLNKQTLYLDPVN
jgi:hypothetical protein